LLNPVAQHESFAQGWGQNYRFGVGWSGDNWAAHVTYMPGRQRTLWAADSTAVATHWKETAIFVTAEARIGQYRRSRPHSDHSDRPAISAVKAIGGVLLFVYSLARLP
jgi:hypothetical protein